MKHSEKSTVVSILLLFVMLTGCDSKTSQSDPVAEKEQSTQRHPFLELHKPKELAVAVTRLVEIHESLMGSGEFPSPIKIDYVEVIHGEGDSGHSHFYLASEYSESGGEVESDGYPGEEVEVDEKVKHYVMEVGSRAEIGDVASWLPGIAAKSNVGESDWTSVSEVSKGLKDIIDSIPDDATDVSFRESWKTKVKDVESMLGKLREIVTRSTGESK